MKKIILGLIATITISNLSFGQATLEHSYSTSTGSGSTSKLSLAFYSATGLHYFTYNYVSKEIIIYDENHLQVKNFILPMDTNQQPHEFFFITDHLINNDNSIEFIYAVSGGTSQAVNICNDNGVLLQSIPNMYYAQLKKNSLGNYKLIVYPGNSSTQNVDVYSLTGTLSTEQQQIYSKNISLAFPNPANDIINISNKLSNNENSTLEVFNIEGKKILEQKVINNNEPIKLDISSFSNGIYIYKLNDETNKFIKN